MKRELYENYIVENMYTMLRVMPGTVFTETPDPEQLVEILTEAIQEEGDTVTHISMESMKHERQERAWSIHIQQLLRLPAVAIFSGKLENPEDWYYFLRTLRNDSENYDHKGSIIVTPDKVRIGSEEQGRIMVVSPDNL